MALLMLLHLHRVRSVLPRSHRGGRDLADAKARHGLFLTFGVLEIVHVVFKFWLGGGGNLPVAVELQNIMRRAPGQRYQADDKG